MSHSLPHNNHVKPEKHHITGRKITILCVSTLLLVAMFMMFWIALQNRNDAVVVSSAINAIGAIAVALTGGLIGGVIGYYFAANKNAVNQSINNNAMSSWDNRGEA